MSFPFKFIGALMLAVLFSGQLHAELVWEHTTIAVAAQPGQKEATAVFKFTNRGAVPIEITDVHANCGCTAAKPAKTRFEPGEAGELPATMTLSGASKVVSVQVKTDQATSSYALSFQVNVFQPAQMMPRLVFWKLGEDPSAKPLTVKLQPGVKLLAAEVQGGKFSTRVETMPNDEATVWVTPVGTGAKAQSTITLTTQLDGQPVFELKGFLRVL